MIKTLLIDDEEDARITLRAYLEEFCPDLEVVGEAEGVKSGLEAIERLKPELVFLDVRLSPGSGFDVLQQVPEVNFEVIFVTAYDEYAIKAIRLSALDYLLKPVDIELLQAAVEKLKTRGKGGASETQLQVFSEIINAQFARLVLPTLDGFVVVELKEIVRAEADRNYTDFFLQDGRKVTVSRTLKGYEELLDDNGFCRIHQSHLVNLALVREYKRRKKGGILILSNGKELPVSDGRKEAFLERFMGRGIDRGIA